MPDSAFGDGSDRGSDGFENLPTIVDGSSKGASDAQSRNTGWTAINAVNSVSSALSLGQTTTTTTPQFFASDHHNEAHTGIVGCSDPRPQAVSTFFGSNNPSASSSRSSLSDPSRSIATASSSTEQTSPSSASTPASAAQSPAEQTVDRTQVERPPDTLGGQYLWDARRGFWVFCRRVSPQVSGEASSSATPAQYGSTNAKKLEFIQGVNRGNWYPRFKKLSGTSQSPAPSENSPQGIAFQPPETTQPARSLRLVFQVGTRIPSVASALEGNVYTTPVSVRREYSPVNAVLPRVAAGEKAKETPELPPGVSQASASSDDSDDGAMDIDSVLEE
ncbi:unnamed protein product [Zymoseptoria tritici ST99CH_3D1]|uniref:Uncharacterized protein n=2 Tax=Zymoseptoria tritici TaxID=1047171 RepID=A0A1X7RNN8_ZYMT9|nr:unnamed protein product [Zymoseptoria tritici ST99CH_3D7]SMR48837.1 unnamed protein product [Zymoseptoria tritici ST99CH_1E4]SMR50021.1 unnamed protein product [Zymoseptoria tritici ST99CH_3D1]